LVKVMKYWVDNIRVKRGRGEVLIRVKVEKIVVIIHILQV